MLLQICLIQSLINISTAQCCIITNPCITRCLCCYCSYASVVPAKLSYFQSFKASNHVISLGQGLSFSAVSPGPSGGLLSLQIVIRLVYMVPDLRPIKWCHHF